MTLPRDYDSWRLSGPDEPPTCPLCDDTGQIECTECGGTGCVHCDDDGAVPCDHPAPDDDYGDYLYEQQRDRRMDDE